MCSRNRRCFVEWWMGSIDPEGSDNPEGAKDPEGPEDPEGSERPSRAAIR
jgi:hypothetical protein